MATFFCVFFAVGVHGQSEEGFSADNMAFRQGEVIPAAIDKFLGSALLEADSIPLDQALADLEALKNNNPASGDSIDQRVRGIVAAAADQAIKADDSGLSQEEICRRMRLCQQLSGKLKGFLGKAQAKSLKEKHKIYFSRLDTEMAAALLQGGRVPGLPVDLTRASPEKADRRPIVVSRLTNVDGSPNFPGMMSFLRSIPMFKRDMEVVDELEKKGLFRIEIENDLPDHFRDEHENTEAYAALAPDSEQQFIVFKAKTIKNSKPGDLLYLLAHEIVHIADGKRLLALLIKHRANLPRELFSDEKGDIVSQRIMELPAGFFIDENFWLYMTEHRAYYAMGRLYNALLNNQFSSVRFAGKDHLTLSNSGPERHAKYDYLDMTAAGENKFNQSFSGATRGLVIRTLAQKGVSETDVDRLNLPARLSPVTAYVLSNYLRQNPGDHSGDIDIRAPYLANYCALSIKEILSGKILKGGLLRSSVGPGSPEQSRKLLRMARAGDLDGIERALRGGADIDAAFPDVNGGETALIDAAERGDEAVIRFLLNHGANVNAKGVNSSGDTALMRALMRGQESIIRLLLDHGAKVNVKNARGDTALMVAAEKSPPAVVELLIKRGAQVNIGNAHRSTPLLEASGNDSPSNARLLLKYEADINVGNVLGFTPLIRAASHDNPAMVRLLLSRGADINAKTNDGKTALLILLSNWYGVPRPQAPSFSDPALTLRLLLGAGADPKAKIYYGTTALHFAAGNGRSAAEIQLLLEQGVPVNAKDKGGSTPLMAAAGHAEPEITEMLLRHGAKVNAKNKLGETPLMIAARRLNPGNAGLLLEHGAKINVKDKAGETPLLLAGSRVAFGQNEKEGDRLALVRLLLDHGADKNAQDKNGRTLLMSAAEQSGWPAIAKLLLRRGADPYGKNKEGQTAYAIAKSAKNQEIATMILKAMASRPTQ